jgi:hypothetical protein
LWALLAVAACKQPGVNTADGELTAPGALHFPATFVGFSSALGLEIDNGSQASRHATLIVQPPFFVDHDGIEVGGGGAQTVQVMFTPTEVSATSGLLTIATDDQTVTVLLDGAGLAQPVCTPSAPCRDSRFAVDAGACVETVSPDDTPCTSQVACLDSAACFQGECVGRAAACSDGNACTEDACDVVAGCIHFDTSARCPAASDPCHAASCDADAGCGTTAVPDGTLCGPHDCISAAVCLAGECKTGVAVPEGFECIPASPCQAAGRCRSQVCVQPPPVPLVPAWTYDPWPNSIYGLPSPLVDGQGNAYWFEAGGTLELVSITPQGFMRFRVTDQFDTFTQPFIAGDAVIVRVLSAGTVVWRAFSVHDGSRLWDFDARAVARMIDGMPSRDLETNSAGAAGHHQVWFAMQLGFPTATIADSVAIGVAVAGVDTDTGTITWSTRIRDAGALTGVGDIEILVNHATDEAQDLYLTLKDTTGYNLISLSAAGVLRWGSRLPVAPSAAYGARVAVVGVSSDGGSIGAVSAIDGTSVGGLELHGLTAPPVLAVFDGAAGMSIAVLDAGAPYGDCNDLEPPYALFAWDLGTGAMTQHTLLGPGYIDGFGPDRFSSMMLLDDRSILTPDWRETCLSDGGIDGRVYQLRRLALDGKELFSCEAPGVFGPMLPMGGTRWFSLASPVDHNIVEAFDLPGVVPAAHGWITYGGNPGGGGAPR